MCLIESFLVLFLAVLAKGKISANESRVVDYVFYCRLRIFNVSNEAAAAVREQDFNLQFELITDPDPLAITTVWLGTDVNDDPKSAAVLYKIVGMRNGSEIIGVNYPSSDVVQEWDRYLDDPNARDDHVGLRCSNGSVTKTSSGYQIDFNKSYKLHVGPRLRGSRVRRPVTLERQTKKDCYAKAGYLHPYTLDPIHRYAADGEKFTVGCSLALTCEDGAYGGLDRCPPVRFPSNAIAVRTPGQCCEDGLLKADLEKAGCPQDQTGSSFHRPTPTAHIPWQVRFQKEDGSGTCDGVIISKHWFLTAKTCLTSHSNTVFLRPLGIKYQPVRFRNVIISEVKPIASDKTLDLALAKINDSFVIDDWTTDIQKVNLPWSSSVCKQFLKENCHLLLGTEQADDESPSTVVAMTDGGSKAAPYIQRIQKIDNEPVLLGSGAVSWYRKAHFLVGIYTGNRTSMVLHKGKVASWRDDTTAGNLVSICDSLDSIKKVIKGDKE